MVMINPCKDEKFDLGDQKIHAKQLSKLLLRRIHGNRTIILKSLINSVNDFPTTFMVTQ